MRLALASLVLLAVFASSTQAADLPPPADIRCLVVASLMIDSKDSKLHEAGILSMLYWFGRVHPFSPQEIEDAMVRESGMSPLQMQSERVRCGEELRAQGETMQSIGKNLIRRSKEKDKAAPGDDSKPVS